MISVAGISGLYDVANFHGVPLTGTGAMIGYAATSQAQSILPWTLALSGGATPGGHASYFVKASAISTHGAFEPVKI